MNHALDTSDIAFGRGVQALQFTRHTLSATVLWSRLPEGWEMRPLPRGSPNILSIRHHGLEHRTLISLPDGMPISMVVEDYASDVLSFEPPR